MDYTSEYLLSPQKFSVSQNTQENFLTKYVLINVLKSSRGQLSHIRSSSSWKYLYLENELICNLNLSTHVQVQNLKWEFRKRKRPDSYAGEIEIIYRNGQLPGGMGAKGSCRMDWGSAKVAKLSSAFHVYYDINPVSSASGKLLSRAGYTGKTMWGLLNCFCYYKHPVKDLHIILRAFRRNIGSEVR